MTDERQPRRMVDEQAAAGHLGCPVATLRTKRTRGGGPPYYKLNGRIRYDLAELDAWIDQHRRLSTSEAA